MGEFGDELARALREWGETIHPKNGLPEIWARIRRHKVKRYIAHFIRRELATTIVSVDLVLDSTDSETATEDWCIAYGNTHFPGLELDTFHEVNR